MLSAAGEAGDGSAYDAYLSDEIASHESRQRVSSSVRAQKQACTLCY
jgi:hypothetical protein